MQPFAYTQPQTLAEATAALRTYPNAALKAGGVDLLDLLQDRVMTPDVVIDLNQIVECQGIRVDTTTGALRIGSLTTFSQLATAPEVQQHWPALAHMAGNAATPQIRNQATLGGNLCQRPRCWYFRQEEYACLKKGGARCYALAGDNRYHAIFANQTCAMTHPSGAAVPLLAYGASLNVLDQTGQERAISLADFFVTPEQNLQRENILTSSEIITAISLPSPPARTTSAYLNVKHKQSFDWPLVEAAVVLTQSISIVQGARVVLGSVAPMPLRSDAAEAELVGKTVTEETAQQAGQAATLGALPLAHNADKIPLLAELVRRTVLKAAGQLPAADEVMPL